MNFTHKAIAILGIITSLGGLMIAARVTLHSSGNAQQSQTQIPVNQRYSIVNLDTLNSRASVAKKINNNGQVVGFFNPNDSTQKAFIYRDGNMTEINSLDSRYNAATSINDNGEIVGVMTFTDDNYRAFLYKNGKTIDLGTLGGKSSDARSINRKGQIVGFAETRND